MLFCSAFATLLFFLVQILARFRRNFRAHLSCFRLADSKFVPPSQSTLVLLASLILLSPSLSYLSAFFRRSNDTELISFSLAISPFVSIPSISRRAYFILLCVSFSFFSLDIRIYYSHTWLSPAAWGSATAYHHSVGWPRCVCLSLSRYTHTYTLSSLLSSALFLLLLNH